MVVGEQGTPPPERVPRRSLAAAGISDRAKLILRRPAVQHLAVAINRFNHRLGSQFAGALTYFSFLTLVPILMVAFSIGGFVLASRPELLAGLRDDIAQQLPQGLSATVTGVLDTAVDSRLTVGVIGLAIALYSGISWMGNLRAAIQAMWRPDFDANQDIAAENLFKYYWKSLMYLVFLGVAILVSLALTSTASWTQQLVLRWLGLDELTSLTPVFTLMSMLIAVAADVLVFLWIYLVLAPAHLKPGRKPVIRGAILMSVAFEALKLGLTLVLPLLLTSVTAKLFGQIIGLLFFFNLVATSVLFVAAWIATFPGQPSAATPGTSPRPLKPSEVKRTTPVTAGPPNTDDQALP